MEAFEVSWDEAHVEAVRRQVRDCRLPPAPAGSGWSAGCDADLLARLREYWLDGYDWKAAVERLNRYPQYRARIGDLDIHFLHVVGEGRDRRPLLLTHGWPGSHYEFWDVIDRLGFPSRYGGAADDSFDLVVPSLPGFGFSGKPDPIVSPRATAARWNQLMTEELGYPRYLAQGGDWGGIVTSWLGLDHGPSVQGIHLNLLAFQSAVPAQNDAERAWMAGTAEARMVLGAYATLQATKPQSIAWAAAGNPLGQAAWIVERFHDWADLGGADVEKVFGLDHLLTNVMIYVMTDSFTSAAWYYRGIAADGGLVLADGQRCEVPTGFAAYPGDGSLPAPPRSRVELLHNLVHWSAPDRGGHFAAMERPETFAADVITWGRQAWPRS